MKEKNELLGIIGGRMKGLRVAEQLSQGKFAKLVGTTQASINRYENAVCAPPPNTLLWYADFFDVSLDYLFGRTDKPQGATYRHEPQSFRQHFVDREHMNQFIEYCLEPGTAGNRKLKSALEGMLEGDVPQKEAAEKGKE